MTEAATIRAVYPAHTMKSLARLMGVPIDTARTWLYRHLCAARRRELALALIAELDRQDIERAVVRQKLNMMAGEINAPVDRILAGPAAEQDRAARPRVGAVAPGAGAALASAAGAPARRMGGGVTRR
jgi:hypothetical protein